MMSEATKEATKLNRRREVGTSWNEATLYLISIYTDLDDHIDSIASQTEPGRLPGGRGKKAQKCKNDGQKWVI
jgi:hypothetical protein